VREGDAAAASAERFSRGALGSAGHDAAAGEVWLDDWSLAFDPDAADGALVLAAAVGAEPLRLTLAPVKPPVSPAADDAPFRGYAMPRLEVRGVLGSGEARRELSGSAWIDRAWGELPIPGAGPVTYDRLLLQLDDGSDLSLVRTRRRDGRGAPTADGALVDAAGAARQLSDPEVEMTPGPLRDAPGGGGLALDWTVRGPGLDLAVEPVVEDQHHAFAQPMWIGLVRVSGSRNGQPVSGLGALQTTRIEPR
jgi:predicted secreted hydrolase